MRVRKPAAIAVIAVAAGLLAPTAASAGTSAMVGPFAIWDQPNFSGRGASMDRDVLVYGNLVYAGTRIRIDNTASSAKNFASNHIVYAFRRPQPKPLSPCDITEPHLLFLRAGEMTAQAASEYRDLAAENFDNQISGHCFT